MQHPVTARTSHPLPAAGIKKPGLLPAYIATLVLTLAAVAACVSTLAFIALSRVRAGQRVEEAWTLGFVVDSPTRPPRPLDARTTSELARSISFKPSGSLEILSAPIAVTRARVSWTDGRTRYTAPGGRVASRVTWRARPDATDGQPGEIDIDVLRSTSVAPPYRGPGD